MLQEHAETLQSLVHHTQQLLDGKMKEEKKTKHHRKMVLEITWVHFSKVVC